MTDPTPTPERPDADQERRDEQDAMHRDLGDLLDALGMGRHARPESPHQVMQQAIAKVRDLAAVAPVPVGHVVIDPARIEVMRNSIIEQASEEGWAMSSQRQRDAFIDGVTSMADALVRGLVEEKGPADG